MCCSLGVAPLWDTAPVTPPLSYSVHPVSYPASAPPLPPHSKCGCVVVALWGAIPSSTKYPTSTTAPAPGVQTHLESSTKPHHPPLLELSALIYNPSPLSIVMTFFSNFNYSIYSGHISNSKPELEMPY